MSVAPVIDALGSGVDGVAGGEGTLTRTADGLSFEIHADELVSGHAYSLWWIIFEKAQFCAGAECGLADLGNPKVRASVLNAGGGVADGNGDAWFFRTLDRHDTGDAFVIFGNSVDNTFEAVIHVVLKSHGLAETIPADLALQTSTPGEFCNLPGPNDPLPPTVCKDVGVVVFP